MPFFVLFSNYEPYTQDCGKSKVLNNCLKAVRQHSMNGVGTTDIKPNKTTNKLTKLKQTKIIIIKKKHQLKL